VPLSTAGSDFQTRLDVYTGAAVNGLTSVASALSTTTVPASLTFNTVQGTTYRLRLSGVSGTAPRGNFVLLLGDAYARWAAQHGLDAATFGPLLDPDTDGLVSLIEYAFSLSPVLSDAHAMLPPGTGTSGLPHVSLDGSGTGPRLRVEFLRRKAAGSPGITCIPQFADTIEATGPSGWQNATGTPVITSVDQVWERVIIEDTTGGARRFARLLVSRP
jgi:hypothetical protein